MSMRWQLLLGFALIIAVVVGTNWFFALRTTDSQLAVFVSEGNLQQARLLAPTLLSEYGNASDWNAVQAALEEQLTRRPWRPQLGGNMGGHGRGNRLLEFGGASAEGVYSFRVDINVPDLALRLSDPVANDFVIVSAAPVPQSAQAVYLESPSLQWMANNLAMTNQRALVIDTTQTVVVDTHKNLLGKAVPADLQARGIALYRDSERVGTLVLTSPDGVYTLEQSEFRAELRRGIMLGGALGAGIALILALLIAYQVTRPIRTLTQATARLTGGEWGYQVNLGGRHEIGELAVAFNQMSRYVWEQRELRVRLVDDLSHELNTPLSLMRLELQAMADGLQSPTEAAEQLQTELMEVTDLVSDLVFLANRDAAPAPNMDWLDLNEVVKNAVKRFEVSVSQNRGVKLIFLPLANLPLIFGDPYLVGRAVSNLIANALRHTPAGGEIRVQTALRGQQVEVSVQDTGEGIPPEHLPHIFERFYRADSSRARQSGGRGLGLAIVREIMEQHGGQVQAESEEGQGSLFRLNWSVS